MLMASSHNNLDKFIGHTDRTARHEVARCLVLQQRPSMCGVLW